MKKVIAILLSDTHLYERTSKYGTPLNNNFSLNHKLFDRVIELSIEHNTENIFHLGDIFDFKKGQSQFILLEFEKILDKFKKANKYLQIIAGNHDKIDERSDNSYLSTFRHHPGIILYEKEQEYPSNGFLFYFLPYYEEEVYNQKLKLLKNKFNFDAFWPENRILLTHQSFNGIEDNEKHTIENSIKVGEDYAAIFSGHIHKRNKYLPYTPHYIGGAIPHNFGEYEPKGITLLHDDLTISFVPLDIISYKTLECNISNIDEIYNQAINLKTDLALVRVNFTGTDVEYEALKTYDFNKYGIKIIRTVKSSILNKNNFNFKFDTKINLKEKWVSFCKENQIKYIDEGLNYLL